MAASTFDVGNVVAEREPVELSLLFNSCCPILLASFQVTVEMTPNTAEHCHDPERARTSSSVTATEHLNAYVEATSRLGNMLCEFFVLQICQSDITSSSREIL